MNKPPETQFTIRPTITLELPLDEHTRILHPEQIILKITNKYHDIGALCYSLRSDKMRKSGQPRAVVTSTLLKQRPRQILQLIKALSSFRTDDGKSLATVCEYAFCIVYFMDWADSNNLHDCLAGGEQSRTAFQGWAIDTHERYKRQQFGEVIHNKRLIQISKLLEAITGLDNLMQGIRKVKRRSNPNCGTEPLAIHDFAHAVAINQSLFDGLSNLVLEQKPFPYKLDLPASLGWAENHLWLFPTVIWRLPPHLWADAIRTKKGSNASWIYDYKNGRIATLDEIEHRYKGQSQSERRKAAIHSIRRAIARLDKANTDPYDSWRLTLGMAAQRAFLFLFICNTGSNAEVVRNLETDGTINSTVQNQQFRGIKWRAGGKEVTLVAPVTFTPRLRKFMELRQYLLQGKNTPFLFFNSGKRSDKLPSRIGDFELEIHYKNLLLDIDPQLPRMGARALRASVDDYYLQFSGVEVAAAVMGHTVETENKKYGRGSANDHHEDMSLFMEAVSESARRQRVTPLREKAQDAPPLEQGGHCDQFGHPEPLVSNIPIKPDCKDSQGCLFCNHRVLIAGEEDARKVASAAYVMEQLILGPKHEEALRPLIKKCDEDLEKIAAFEGCSAMVKKVQKDVYDNENLTPFWADKYQLLLELEIIS